MNENQTHVPSAGEPAEAAETGTKLAEPDLEIIASAIFLLFLLIARFVPPQFYPKVPCLLRVTTGIPCVMCGGTRAWIAASHFRFQEALSLNPLATFLLLGGCVFALYSAAVIFLKVKPVRIYRVTRREALFLRVGAVLILVVNWAVVICLLKGGS